MCKEGGETGRQGREDSSVRARRSWVTAGTRKLGGWRCEEGFGHCLAGASLVREEREGKTPPTALQGLSNRRPGSSDWPNTPQRQTTSLEACHLT